MDLTVRDIAVLFNVSEKTVYRWISGRRIPVLRINKQYRFNRAEVLRWAGDRRMQVQSTAAGGGETETLPAPDLAQALETGGIYYRVEGEDTETVFRSAAGLMSLPPEVDREQLLTRLLEREAMAPTAVGDGIAFPHPRDPWGLGIPSVRVSLCFLEMPVDFGAIDGKPVHAVFIVLSPTTRDQLRILASLAFALKDPAFREAVGGVGSRGTILREARRVAAQLDMETPVAS